MRFEDGQDKHAVAVFRDQCYAKVRVQAPEAKRARTSRLHVFQCLRLEGRIWRSGEGKCLPAPAGPMTIGKSCTWTS